MSHACGMLGQSRSLNMGYGWSHLIGVLTVVYPLAQPLMVEWWIVIFLQQNLFQRCKKITQQQLITSETSKWSIIIISFLTIRYGMQNKRLLQRYSGIGKSLTKGWESCSWHTWIKNWHPILVYTIPRDEFSDSILHYVFWIFAPCIEGFRHCKLVISIDGTHLYGKYQGVLLIAMATDANNKVLPLTFTVVDKESGPSWGWFLECFRISLGDVIAKKDICVISDQHKGIQKAIANWPRNDDG